MLTLVVNEDALTSVSLSFAYPGHAPLVRDLSLQLPRGSRCLLCGANGGGACAAAGARNGARAAAAEAAAGTRAQPRLNLPPPAHLPRARQVHAAPGVWWKDYG